MITRILVSLFLAVAAAAPAVHAQSNTHVTPSVAIGAVYDENILWNNTPQSDHVWRAEPRLDLVSETVRSRLWFQSSMDTTWYSRHRDLSSALARQDASTEWSWQNTPVSSIGLSAGYYNTTDPADVDPTTGWSLGRLRTWRLMVAPEYTHSITPRVAANVRFVSHAEFASDVDDLTTQTVQAETRWLAGERDELRAVYALDRFGFASGARLSHRPTVFWVHRLTPLTQVMLGGGVRLTEGDPRPAVDAAVSHRAGQVEATVSYAWSQTASLGVDRLFDVQRVLGTVRYGRPGSLVASVHAGAYLNTVGDQRVDVWRGGFDVLRPLWGPLAISATYSIDYQRNALPVVPWTSSSPVDTPTVVDPLSPRPDPHARRSVFAIRLVFTGPVFASIARSERPVDLVRDPHRGGLQ